MFTNPNRSLWQRYADYGENRGGLVIDQISPFFNISKCRILDLGSGKGSLSIAFAKQGAQIFSADEIRFTGSSQNGKGPINYPYFVQTRAEELCFRVNAFDIVLLNDVLEHIRDPDAALKNITLVLKENGGLWISTPNRWSPANLICDPHYSLPALAAFPRSIVKKVIIDWLKWHPPEKKDLPELWSFNRLVRSLERWNYKITFVNNQVAKYGFRVPESIWSRPIHLNLVRQARKVGLVNIVLKYIRNDRHWLNRWIQPTWYLFAKAPEKPRDFYE